MVLNKKICLTVFDKKYERILLIKKTVPCTGFCKVVTRQTAK